MAPGSKGTGLRSSGALLRELQAARRSETILRDFIERSTIGLHWVDADGRVL